jgi:hypothetical protein
LDVGVLDPFGDPPLDTTESVPEVSSCLESRRALASVSRRVQGGHRHVQVVGELGRFDAGRVEHFEIILAEPEAPTQKRARRRPTKK